MKKTAFLAILVSALMLSAPAFAVPVGVAEVGVVPGSPYTNLSGIGTVYTGYYVLDIYSSPGQLLYDNLNSFCVDPGNAPTGISFDYNMGAVPDEIRYHEAAWLLTQVGVGGYTATDVQRAIWFVMGMGPNPVDIGLVVAASSHSTFDTSGFVFFSSPLNSTPGDGSYGKDAQDYIARVPEPGTMLLLGAGLLGVAIFARRKCVN